LAMVRSISSRNRERSFAMKTPFNIAVLAVLLVAPSPCCG
jgi:hypothetical protein